MELTELAFIFLIITFILIIVSILNVRRITKLPHSWTKKMIIIAFLFAIAFALTTISYTFY